MSFSVTITRLAKLDIDELIVYLGQDNPKAAVDVASKILDRIRWLRDHPAIGRPGRRPGTRELVIEGTRYIVAYRVNNAQSRVEVLRVLHTSRRWPEKL